MSIKQDLWMQQQRASVGSQSVSEGIIVKNKRPNFCVPAETGSASSKLSVCTDWSPCSFSLILFIPLLVYQKPSIPPAATLSQECFGEFLDRVQSMHTACTVWCPRSESCLVWGRLEAQWVVLLTRRLGVTFLCRAFSVSMLALKAVCRWRHVHNHRSRDAFTVHLT